MANRFNTFQPQEYLANLAIYKENLPLMKETLEKQQQLWDAGQTAAFKRADFIPNDQSLVEQRASEAKNKVDSIAKLYTKGALEGNRALRQYISQIQQDWNPGGTEWQIQQRANDYKQFNENLLQAQSNGRLRSTERVDFLRQKALRESGDLSSGYKPFSQVPVTAELTDLDTPAYNIAKAVEEDMSSQFNVVMEDGIPFYMNGDTKIKKEDKIREAILFAYQREDGIKGELALRAEQEGITDPAKIEDYVNNHLTQIADDVARATTYKRVNTQFTPLSTGDNSGSGRKVKDAADESANFLSGNVAYGIHAIFNDGEAVNFLSIKNGAKYNEELAASTANKMVSYADSKISQYGLDSKKYFIKGSADQLSGFDKERLVTDLISKGVNPDVANETVSNIAQNTVTLAADLQSYRRHSQAMNAAIEQVRQESGLTDEQYNNVFRPLLHQAKVQELSLRHQYIPNGSEIYGALDTQPALKSKSQVSLNKVYVTSKGEVVTGERLRSIIIEERTSLAGTNQSTAVDSIEILRPKEITGEAYELYQKGLQATHDMGGIDSEVQKKVNEIYENVPNLSATHKVVLERMDNAVNRFTQMRQVNGRSYMANPNSSADEKIYDSFTTLFNNFTANSNDLYLRTTDNNLSMAQKEELYKVINDEDDDGNKTFDVKKNVTAALRFDDGNNQWVIDYTLNNLSLGDINGGKNTDFPNAQDRVVLEYRGQQAEQLAHLYNLTNGQVDTIVKNVNKTLDDYDEYHAKINIGGTIASVTNVNNKYEVDMGGIKTTLDSAFDIGMLSAELEFMKKPLSTDEDKVSYIVSYLTRNPGISSRLDLNKSNTEIIQDIKGIIVNQYFPNATEDQKAKLKSNQRTYNVVAGTTYKSSNGDVLDRATALAGLKSGSLEYVIVNGTDDEITELNTYLKGTVNWRSSGLSTDKFESKNPGRIQPAFATKVNDVFSGFSGKVTITDLARTPNEAISLNGNLNSKHLNGNAVDVRASQEVNDYMMKKLGITSLYDGFDKTVDGIYYLYHNEGSGLHWHLQNI